MRRTLLTTLVVTGLAGMFLISCTDGDGTKPGDQTGTGSYLGSVDPTAGTFVLNAIDSTGPNGVPVHVELLGSNLQVDAAAQEVSLDVAVRNAGQGPLYAPAEVVVFDLDPPTVWVPNADRTACADGGPGPDQGLCWYGFDYSELLGADDLLSSGEISGSKRWVFRVPGLVGFSFGATAQFGMGPDRPRIAGFVWGDQNENGVRDPGELGFGGGTIEVVGPGLGGLVVQVPGDGGYMFPVSEPGLYILTAVPPPTFAPVHATTPNPLQVVLPPGPEGEPESYLHANFGFANDLFPPPGEGEPVGFWDGPPDSLEQDPYHLLDIRLEGFALVLRVGFSGCSNRHPFGLYMVGGFMESEPVQARLLLSHDDHGELCDAYFEKTLRYDLTPILRKYYREYGYNGVVIVNFHAWNGEVHSFRIQYVNREG